MGCIGIILGLYKGIIFFCVQWVYGDYIGVLEGDWRNSASVLEACRLEPYTTYLSPKP